MASVREADVTPLHQAVVLYVIVSTPPRSYADSVTLIPRHLVCKIAMLLLAAMLIAPVMDAFACAAEIPSVHAGEASLDAPSAEELRSNEHGHGVCGHNHCHHTIAHVTAQVAIADASGAGGAPHMGRDADRVSNVSDGLFRPPRI